MKRLVGVVYLWSELRMDRMCRVPRAFLTATVFRVPRFVRSAASAAMSRMHLLGTVSVLMGMLLMVGRATGEPLINEVLYDPEGPDGGREFIELYNPDGRPVSLEGCVLEAGNGDRPGDWRVQWSGGRQDVIPGGGYFVVAGDEAEVAADARSSLVLQNGPDALRLSLGGRVLDTVGWGDLVHAEFFEGEPTPDVPSGWVLARVPNGADSGSNYNDWLGRPWTTAGRSNTPEFGVQIISISLDPPIISLGHKGVLRTVVRNLGTGLLKDDEIECEFVDGLVRASRREETSDAVDSGGSVQVAYDLVPEAQEGGGRIRIRLLYRGAVWDSAAVTTRVGYGRVVVSELLYDPVAGEAEWIELRNLSSRETYLAEWTVEDASGQMLTITPGVSIAPGAVGILTEDENSFLARWPEVASSMIVPWDGRWPSLNNQVNRELGYADQILVRDSEMIPSDFVRYSPTEFDGDGVSLERWIEGDHLVSPQMLIPCSAGEGATPGGGMPSGGLGAEGSRWLNPFPNPFYPDQSETPDLCRMAIPPSRAADSRVTADVFDLAGHRVCCLRAAAQQQSAVVLSWDGRSSAREPLPTGLYVWRVMLGGAAQGDVQRMVCPVTLVRGE